LSGAATVDSQIGRHINVPSPFRIFARHSGSAAVSRKRHSGGQICPAAVSGKRSSMDAKYLNSTVSDGLTQGFAALARLQPDDPIDYLGKWLIKHADSVAKSKEVGDLP
jgi:hypothetical protein